jgi:hypothetical protein
VTQVREAPDRGCMALAKAGAWHQASDGKGTRAKAKRRQERLVPSVSIQLVEHQREAPTNGLLCAWVRDDSRKGTVRQS